MSEKIPTKLAGTWRRIGAIAVDTIVLAAVGYPVGLLFSDTFAAMGWYGRLIGFPVQLAYFTLLNSSMGRGQTLGKRLLHIQVTNERGEYISVGRSFTRSLVLLLPFLLNGIRTNASIDANYHLDAGVALLGAIAALIVFVVGPGDIYFFIFNRRTHQALHDLAASTLVTNTRNQEAPQLLERTWRGHYAVFSGIVAVVTAIVVHSFQNVANEVHKSEVLQAYQSLQKMDGVSSVVVTEGEMVVANLHGSRPASPNVGVNIVLSKKPESYEKVADQAARRVLNAFPDSKWKDNIAIQVTYGFDIGIASWSRSQRFVHSPTEWQQRVPASE